MPAPATAPMSVGAMTAGAFVCRTTSFRGKDVRGAGAAAIQRDQQARQADDAASALRATYDLLTVREREVMALVTAGLINKQVATRLGLSEITVKIHRGQVMRKMKAKSLADLVRMGESLGLHQKAHPS